MEEEDHLPNCVVTQTVGSLEEARSAPSHLGWTCDDKLGSAFEDRNPMMIVLRMRNIMRVAIRRTRT